MPRDHDRQPRIDDRDKPPPPPPSKIPTQKIYMISGGGKEDISNRERKVAIRQVWRMENDVMEIKRGGGTNIAFGPQDDRALLRPHNDTLVIIPDVARVWIARTFIDMRILVNIMYTDCLKQLNLSTELQPPLGSLFGFLGEMVTPVGTLCMPIILGSPDVRIRKMIEFVILDLPNMAYNIIIGRSAQNAFQAVVSVLELYNESMTLSYRYIPIIV